jgi:hypothetical protein
LAKIRDDLARVVRFRFARILFRGYQRFPIFPLLQARLKTTFWILLKYQNDPEADGQRQAQVEVPSSQ